MDTSANGLVAETLTTVEESLSAATCYLEDVTRVEAILIASLLASRMVAGIPPKGVGMAEFLQLALAEVKRLEGAR